MLQEKSANIQVTRIFYPGQHLGQGKKTGDGVGVRTPSTLGVSTQIFRLLLIEITCIRAEEALP